MQQKLQNTKNLVLDVFNKVYDKYDLMNNLMRAFQQKKFLADIKKRIQTPFYL